MRGIWRPLALSAIVLLGLAQGEESAEEAHARKVRELLDVGGEIGAVMGNMFLQGGARAKRHLLLLPGPTEAYLDVFVPIYGKHLDDETVDAALAFFRSPAGRKYMAGLWDACKEWAIADAKPDSELNRKLNEAAAASQCKSYYDQVMTWKTMHKKLPQKLEDLSEEMVPGMKIPFAELRPDPWGHMCVLHVSDGKPTIVGLGPDGVEGTADDIAYPRR